MITEVASKHRQRAHVSARRKPCKVDNDLPMVLLDTTSKLRESPSKYGYTSDKLLVTEHKDKSTKPFAPAFGWSGVDFRPFPDPSQEFAIHNVSIIFWDTINEIMYDY